METITHSVTLDADKCKGCINCIKRCPTEAIRVRNGKAVITSDRCIDCGECIRACPNHAKKAISDPVSMMDSFKYKVALPAPTLYGQFKKVNDVNAILTALLEAGFDDIFEVALAAQSISDYINKFLPGARESLSGPVISSACPVVVKLISIRYPALLDNVIKVVAPVELSAIAARKKAVEKTGLSPEEIGIFFISPCPAKITASKHPIGFDNAVIDGVFSITEMYRALAPVVERIKEPKNLSSAGVRGIGWASSGGEGSAIGEALFVAADGIHNIIRVLDELENDKLQSVRFVELNACPAGCVGGCLAVENPFVARARIQRLSQSMTTGNDHNEVDKRFLSPRALTWSRPLEYEAILRIDADRSIALRKLAEMESILEALPGIDCGSCGAPSCRALAEDIVMGAAHESDCVFKLREQMKRLFREMAELQEYTPPPFREPNANTHKTEQ